MTRTTGHVIRITGLVIEMIGVWGFYSSSVDKAAIRGQQPGGSGVSWPWIVVGVGFVIWLIGRLILNSAGRSKPKAIWDEQRELTP